MLDGQEHWLTGALRPGELTIAQQIERSGAPALLLEHYAGRLEHHDPWHTAREVSHLFRGLVTERGRPGARRARLRGPAAGGQRLGEPGGLHRPGGTCPGAGLPPTAGGSLEGGGRGLPPPARGGTRARRRLRSATPARTWQARRTCTPSGWWPTRCSATRRSARRSPSTGTRACARRPTARGSTRPCSAHDGGVGERQGCAAAQPVAQRGERRPRRAVTSVVKAPSPGTGSREAPP